MRPKFTQREFEILEAASAGHDSTDELAKIFSLSPRTITTHFGNMFERTGIHKRSKLISAAIRNGWLSESPSGE